MLQDRSGSLDDMQEAEKQEQAQEQRMLRALRKLQVVPRAVREEACKALLRSLRSQGHLTLDKFKECLQAEHEKNAIEEKRKKMDADHREKLSQKALKRALRTDNKRAVQEQVAEWATRAQQGGPGVQRAEDVTRRCVQEARAAMARTQLKDYVDELRNHLESRQGELFKLQSEAEEEARLVGDFFPMGPMQTPPAASVARRRGLGGMFGVADPGDTSFENRPLTPDTPATPYTTGSRTPMTVKSRTASKNSLRPESKAKRAEQLVQAAASGDVAALQRLLGGDADPNAVGWSGATPLMAAAHHGREAAIDLLVLMGADVLRTDVRGRTALDHAYRRPSTRERLRAYGAMTGSDLERRAQDLARRVLQVEQERAKLEAQLSQLPSKEVRERQIALQHRSVSGLLSPPTLNSPRRRTRSTPSMLNVSVDEYNEGDAVAAPQAPPEMTRAASAPTPSIETGLPASALARRSPHDSAKKDKQTRIVLPVKQRGEA